ncbi:uncharacterized protein EDB91DRAFT_1335997 [Suillus paluster]|uniref:uncharacterized protein n=1 Tax=Suillus paluster TaxID=48578 RepID=UPI001B87C2B3|nr:uncharacterized protein EDB91DRAFT_1335997 [Suillus paluster]KAG1742707.1 hypothetical protein EDB91DRAFT_1335997 [Suillus paluster]
MRVMENGFCADSEEGGGDWTSGMLRSVIHKVEKVLSKGLLLVQKLLYYVSLSLPHPLPRNSQFYPQMHHRVRYHIRHTLSVNHLDVITLPPSSPPGANFSLAPPICAPALQATLTAIDTLITLACQNHQRSGLGDAKSVNDAIPRWNSITARDFNALSHPSPTSPNCPHNPLIHLPLTFLVGATAKRDPAGTNPKRRLWAEAGISIVNGGKRGYLTLVPLWASLADRRNQTTHKIRLTTFLSLTHSPTPTAPASLSTPLTHVLGDSRQAYYRAARAVNDERNAGAAACAGEALLRTEIRAHTQGGAEDLKTYETYALTRFAIQRCCGMGGTLEAVGNMLQAAVGGARGEIVGANPKYTNRREPSPRITPRVTPHPASGSANNSSDIFKRADKPHRMVKQEIDDAVYRCAVDGEGEVTLSCVVKSDAG